MEITNAIYSYIIASWPVSQQHRMKGKEDEILKLF